MLNQSQNVCAIINRTFQKNIVEIKSGINNSSSLTEKQVLDLSKKINLEACAETVPCRNEAYANENYLDQIIRLTSIFEDNSVILRNIISAVGFICSRYSFYHDKYFCYLKQNLKNEANIVKIAIVKNIYKFPQFGNDRDLCHFLLDIPKISPRKESIEYFYRAVYRHIEQIPKDILIDVKKYLKHCIDKQMVNQYQKVDFESLIEIISKKFE